MEKPAQPHDGYDAAKTARDLRCPKCGDDEIKWAEYVATSRHIHGLAADGTLIVDTDDEVLWDDTKDEHLYCLNCFHEWPRTGEIDFRDASEVDGYDDLLYRLHTAVTQAARPLDEPYRRPSALATEDANVLAALDAITQEIRTRGYWPEA